MAATQPTNDLGVYSTVKDFPFKIFTCDPSSKRNQGY